MEQTPCINKVLLSGKVGTVPQLQKLSNQTHLCYFSLSVMERWTSSDGQPMERNNWFKVEVLGKNAHYAFNAVKKGETYFIDGYLRFEKYTKDDGDKSIVKVRAFSVVPLSSGNGGSICENQYQARNPEEENKRG